MWSDSLRDEQATAAGAPRANTVLLAGPGTGKTFVLVRRVQYLVEVAGVFPEEIVALTFSRAAAAEMRTRLEEDLGQIARKVKVSTLHSFALRKLLRNGAHQLPQPLRVADDWEERWVVVEELAQLLGKMVKEIRNYDDGFLDRLSDDWDTLAIDGEGWQSGFADPQALGMWQRHRWVYGYTLRAELVYQLLAELRANPDFDLGKIAELPVDEYQDLNRCDLNTVGLVADRTGAFVYAAGDDDQSIYSFRHAVPEGIRSFDKDYPKTQRLTLRECLRCGADVVTLANWLIAQEENREPKELESITSWPAKVDLLRFANQEAEAAALARAVKAEIDEGTRAEEILILVRSDANSRISSAVQEALQKLEVAMYLPRPPKTTDSDVQRVIEYIILSLALREDVVDDLAVRALLELEENGIGEKRIQTVLRLALDKGVRFTAALEEMRANPSDYKSTMQAVVAAFDEIVEQAKRLAPIEGESFDSWLVRLSGELGLPDDTFGHLLELTRAVAGVVELELEQGTEASEAGNLEEQAQLDYIIALRESMGSLSDVMPSAIPGRVTFTTMHGAKGLTAETVFVLQAEDEIIPGDASGHGFDESRRLLYVSLTRAKKHLVICACTHRTGPQRFSGQSESAQRHLTRFLDGYGLHAQTIAQYLAGKIKGPS